MKTVRALVVVAVLGCGGPPSPGTPRPDPGVLVPRLFDPTDLYREMGFLAEAEPVPFVASVHFVAGPTPDTVFALVGISFASNALSFRRAGPYFEARYRAEVTFEAAGRLADQVAATEVVRVASFSETLRADESIIFQQIARVPPGSVDVRITVRDLYGDQVTRDERTMTVPRFESRALAAPVPVHRAAPRADAGELPRLLINPRATAPFGRDSLRFYVEAYAAEMDSIAIVAMTGDGVVFWRRRVALEGGGAVRTARIGIAPQDLPVGRLSVQAVGPGADTVAVQALVSFSDQWTITSFHDVLELLRYYGPEETLDTLRNAPPAERAERWRAFWGATDPAPATPRNEALEEYFHRVHEANARFHEAGQPGWLTDRGEVYITLGAPDEVLDRRADFEGTRRVIRWVYVRERLTVDFIDDTGFGRFRMTPFARSEFERVVRRRGREESS
jgi:GWxTD domain-containing protein